MAKAVACPGCGGTMYAGSRCCRSCRRRAIEIGVQALIDRHTRGAAPLDQITPGQRRAFHAKANDLDRFTLARGEAKRRVLSEASERFGRPIASANDLSQIEASWAIDWLEDQLNAAALAEQPVLPELA